jgi:hypothetical protein
MRVPMWQGAVLEACPMVTSRSATYVKEMPRKPELWRTWAHFFARTMFSNFQASLVSFPCFWWNQFNETVTFYTLSVLINLSI